MISRTLVMYSLSRQTRRPALFLPAIVGKSLALSLLAILAIAFAPCNAKGGAADYVQSIDWSKYNGMFGVDPGDAFGQSLVGMLQNEARYELNWVPSEYNLASNAPGFEGTPYYDAYTDFSTYGYEGSVRPLAGFAYGTAALLATGTYSESVTGISASQALYQTELAIRGVAFAHKTNKPSDPRFGGRGTTSSTWQAAHWASHTMLAAWLLWDDLSSETRTAVADMVVYEANSTAGYTVPYWKTPSGATNYYGDTKAEENAWNAELPALAQAMMPNVPVVEAWREKASELQVSSYSRQSDNFSQELVDGRPLADWLNGFNSFEDGVVINHNRVHPDYMVSSYLQASAAIYESLAGQFIPQSTVFNIDNVYHALTELNFTPGPDTLYGTGRTILEPGGTIYKRTVGGGYSANVYYPHGNDWTYQVTDSYLNIDLVAEWLGLDEGKSFDAMGWAQARVAAMIALQNRPGHDGNIYEDGDWIGGDRGVDEDIYRSNAAAWLHWWLMQNDQMSPITDHWGALPTIPGDTDGDNVVDEEDAAVLAAHWGQTGLAGGFTVGDFNLDGAINAADASILAANWGSHAMEATPTPEPGAIALFFALAITMLPRRMRRYLPSQK
ncbi:MAG: hypothetical protein JW719_00320 [Pirellulales bacterium]|nr:hypothetical protein [Pirellulales bacterium]